MRSNPAHRQEPSLFTRREVLGALAVAPVAAAFAALARDVHAGAASDSLPASTEKNWPLYRGDVLASGIAKSKLSDSPEQLWKMEVKNGAFEATPIIVDGVVYIGDMDGKLFALDLATGKEKWNWKIDSGFIASPAYRDGLLYLGDIDGVCHCLEASTGKEKWKFAAEAEVDASANFWRDKVLFASQDTNLYCRDAATGKEVWKYAIPDQIRCTPTVVGDRSFVAGCDGKLHIIDLTKGAGAAEVPIESPTGVTPAVLGDYVYFGTEGGIFFSINWKEAKVTWQKADDDGQGYRSSPAVAEGICVVGSRSRKVLAFDPATGNEVWTFVSKQRIDSSPVIAGERVIIGAADGRLYGLDKKTGKEIWQQQATGGFVGSPAVADGKIVIASDRGVVYCFGAKG